MSKKNRILIPCEEANHVCDKNQYKEASLLEMVKLNIHLIYCRVCRKYTVNNTKLSKALKKSKIQHLEPSVKKSMKEDFEKVIKEVNS